CSLHAQARRRGDCHPPTRPQSNASEWRRLFRYSLLVLRIVLRMPLPGLLLLRLSRRLRPLPALLKPLLRRLRGVVLLIRQRSIGRASLGSPRASLAPLAGLLLLLLCSLFAQLPSRP